MEIFKIIADKKPKECLTCILNTRTNSSICGKIETTYNGGWQSSGRVPDERCIIEVSK